MGWLITFLNDFLNVMNDITSFIIQPIEELGGVSILNILSIGLVGFLLTMLVLHLIRG